MDNKNMNKQSVIMISVLIVFAGLVGWFVNNQINQEAASLSAIDRSQDENKNPNIAPNDTVDTSTSTTSTNSDTTPTGPATGPAVPAHTANTITVTTLNAENILQSGFLRLAFKGYFSGNTSGLALTRYVQLRRITPPSSSWVQLPPVTGTTTAVTGNFENTSWSINWGFGSPLNFVTSVTYEYRACVEYTTNSATFQRCGNEKPLVLTSVNGCASLPGYGTPPCLFKASNSLPMAYPTATQIKSGVEIY